MQRSALTFIVLTVTLDAMGIGLIFPVMPTLIQEVVPNSDIGHAAIWGGVLATIFSVMQFIFSPTLGSLSDRFGRKPVLLLSLLVMAADYVLMAVASTIWLLLIGRIIGGITAATHATATAYVADISAPEKKAANFGLIGAGFGVGFVLGPIIGGVLAEYGSRAPFWAAAALALLNAGFGLFVLRETVTEDIRRPFSLARANPFGAFRSIASFPSLRPLLFVAFFYFIAVAVYPAIWSYFTAHRFGWSPSYIGISLAVYGVSMAIVQAALIQPTINRFGELRTVTIGLILEVICLGIIAFISSGPVLLFMTPISALGAVGMAALQSMMSRNVAKNAQGELQGVMTSLNAIAMIVAPVTMTQVFEYFIRPDAPVYLPGAPFLLASVLMAVSLVVYLRARRNVTLVT